MISEFCEDLEESCPYFFLVRANTPPPGGGWVTGFLKVGDWFFGRTPSPPGGGGVRQNPKSGFGAEGAEKFIGGFFRGFAWKMP